MVLSNQPQIGWKQQIGFIHHHYCRAGKADAGKADEEKHASAAVAEPEEEEKDYAGGSYSLPIMLSNNRRADKSEFKGKTYINIREYYEVKPALTQS